MENYSNFLAPIIAVVFFVLLGVVIFCFYNKSCDRSEEGEEEYIEEQKGQQQLNKEAADSDFVERKSAHSAVNDYLVVVHH